MTAKERLGRRGRREASAALGMRVSECLVRFLLAAALAGAEVPEGHALFGLAMVGVAGPGWEGFAALAGAALGYLSFRGFLEGLRYVAASMMIYAVALALGEFSVYHRRWFVPLVSALLNGLVGFVYLSAGGWSGARAAAFVTEVALTAGAVYFYRHAFSVWEERRRGGLTLPQQAGLAVLGLTLLMTLEGVTLGGVLSVGRVLCALAVLVLGWKGGVGSGAAAGILGGFAMDLAASSRGCTAVYALSGLAAGVFSGRGRGFASVGCVLAAAAAAVLSGAEGADALLLREMGAAAVLLPVIPPRLLGRISALTRQEGAREEERRTRDYTARRLRNTAGAYRAVCGGLEGLFAPPPNDGDAIRIFDRAAERVCVECARREQCWQQGYQATRTALADALPRLLDRGEGKGEDFPRYFADRCLHFPLFLRQVNRELEQLRLRRMFDARLRESRRAVCAQYGALAGELERAAAEVGAELAVDVRRQRQVRQRMTALGLDGRCAVFCDEHRRLRIELEGTGVEALGEGEEPARLAGVLGFPLRVEKKGPGELILAQQEPFMAVAGLSALGRDGIPVSGDTGAWFKDERGVLYVLLCDGMGSGLAAHRDSDGALRLLEQFLRAGAEPEGALRVVGDALALRGEAEGGFTTVDLLRLDLFTGQGAVYKLGAAPTYLRRGERVTRLEGSSLPAGLAGEGCEADVFPVEVQAEDWVVMVSDGIAAGGEDGWLRRALEEYKGRSPRELAAELMAASREHGGGGDDRTVIALRIAGRS